MSWFITEVLNNATNTFDITPTHIVEVVVLALMAVVIVIVSRRQGRRQGPIVAGALGAAPLIIYAPNLIVDETWAAYRTLTALSSLVLVFILVAARELAQRSPGLYRIQRPAGASMAPFRWPPWQRLPSSASSWQ